MFCRDLFFDNVAKYDMYDCKFIFTSFMSDEPFMADSAPVEARMCIICHGTLAPAEGHPTSDVSRAQTVRQACVCRECVFCDECWRQYRARGFTTCPVCRDPLAHTVDVASTIESIDTGPNAGGADRPLGRNQEMTECQIMTSPKLARRAYFLPFWYTVFLVGVIATSA